MNFADPTRKEEKRVYDRAAALQAEVEKLRNMLHMEKYPMVKVTEEAWQEPMQLCILCGGGRLSEGVARLVYFNGFMQKYMKSINAEMRIERVPMKYTEKWRVMVTWK